MDKDFSKILTEKLAFENGVSISTKQHNEFVDTIYITANQTNASLTIHLDYVEKKIYFWNDCDEKFIQPIDEQSIGFIINKIKNELERTYYFQVISHNQSISSFPIKIDGAVDVATVRAEAIELKQYINEEFDYINVYNFIGSKRYVVKFNKDDILIE